MDVEWRSFVEREAEQLIAEAKERFCRVWGWSPEQVTTVIAGNRSSGKGLVQVAERRGSDMIVIGAAPNAASGRFVIGSTADKLLHSAGVPVAVALPATPAPGRARWARSSSASRTPPRAVER